MPSTPRPLTRRPFPAIVGTLLVAAVLAAGADIGGDPGLQYQRGADLFDDARYDEALTAFVEAVETEEPALALRARKGGVRSALRLAEFGRALEQADELRSLAPEDHEALTLHADAQWSAGLFDEAERGYQEGLAREPGSARARFGVARSLAETGRLDEALDAALAASAAAPRDRDVQGLVAEIHQRRGEYLPAAVAFRRYVDLLPSQDRSDKVAWARAQAEFFESFGDRTPLEVDEEDLRGLHTMPFELRNGKVIVRGRINDRRTEDFVLDTGAEETVLSNRVARLAGVRPITRTLTAGVGAIGLQGLELARIDSLTLGSLEVRNVPTLIKQSGLRDVPGGELNSFSPLALGMSLRIDYERRRLTLARTLPPTDAEIRLPMRVHRLALVRGVLNADRPAPFVVDTGGEVISISTATASALPTSPFRRIPLLVWGVSGRDRDAFLLPGVDLSFEQVVFRNHPLVVLNLRAPSMLLGFQLGGIVGHAFLAPYRVTMDLQRSELLLDRY
jgi:predicted aspartyl protease/Flp pilus assembly protein TadD